MKSKPSQSEIQQQLEQLSSWWDRAGKLFGWVRQEVFDADPVLWRKKRLELEMLILAQEISDLEGEIQHRKAEEEK